METAVVAKSATKSMPDTTQMPVEPPVEQPPLSMPETVIDDTAMDSGAKMTMPESSSDTGSMATSPTPVPSPPTQTAMIEKPPAPARRNNNVSSDGWLQQLNPQDYVVQLVASADQRGLDRFLAANQNSISSPFSTARTLSKGREWHVVLMGPFSNRSQANAAINQLPSRLRQNNPWVRQVSSVLSAAR
jgi:septal ring-binding cell division protein DamX